MADLDLKRVCEFLTTVAQEAGQIILSARPAALTIVDKKNSADIVTETDQAVEAFIHRRVKERYPEYGFVGEESYHSGVGISDQPTFVVDPIDGTSNFAHGFGEACVSVGVLVRRKPTVGVVHNPFRNELWTAASGQGAFWSTPWVHEDGTITMKRQKLPLTSAPLQGLRPACIGIEFGSDREGPNFELNLKVFSTLVRTTTTGGRFVNSLRCTGSAALAICRVAAGQQDAFWECGCWAWDVAAAWCILREAGGIMVDGHPGEWNPPIDNRRYLAVRPAPEGQHAFVEDFWAVIGEDRSSYGPPR